MPTTQIRGGQILDTSVDTADLKDDAVSLTKIANIAAGTMLGNNTVSLASPVAMTQSDVRTFIGTGSGGGLDADLLDGNQASAFALVASGIPNAGATTQVVQWSSAGVGKWVSLSGDVTIADGGATAIGLLKVTNAMIAASTIDLTAKVTGILPSANGGTGVNNAGRTLTINTNNGTISFTTAVTLTVAATASVSGTNTGDQTLPVGIPVSGATTQLLQWSSSGVAKWITLSGDVTIANGGATAIGALKVTNAMIAATTIDLTAKVTGTLPAGNGGTGYSNSYNLQINAASVIAGSLTGGGTLITGGHILTLSNTATLSGTNTGDQTLPTWDTLANIPTTAYVFIPTTPTSITLSSTTIAAGANIAPDVTSNSSGVPSGVKGVAIVVYFTMAGTGATDYIAIRAQPNGATFLSQMCYLANIQQTISLSYVSVNASNLIQIQAGAGIQATSVAVYTLGYWIPLSTA